MDISIRQLLSSGTLTVRDIVCCGTSRGCCAEECTSSTHLVFPYQGVFRRHVGRNDFVADANQVLFFNEGESYRISHPVNGGDSCLSLSLQESVLDELVPEASKRASAVLAFREQRGRIDPYAQKLVAQLRHSLFREGAETLEGEALTLALVRHALGERETHVTPAGARSAGVETVGRARSVTAVSVGRAKLVDRAKLVLGSDLARRWTLAEVASEVGVSPVYLTQVFQLVEGCPLYRYQLRLRLARALDLLGQFDDLTTLGLHLGFSSHSHFSAAFRQTYGATPAQFRNNFARGGH